MESPDILVLVLDSVRRDRVSAYGHRRPTTPNLDAFSTRATVFEHAFAPAPWTLPTHTSIFTGLAPSEHGVTTWFSDAPTGLPAELETLAERLSEQGYRTAGFSNNPWVGSFTGMDRGFDEFVEWDLAISQSTMPGLHTWRRRILSRLHTVLGTVHRQPIFLLKRRFFTRQLVDRAIDWLALTDDDRPTFTFLNLMEAHSPYFPPGSSFSDLGLSPPGMIEPRVLNTKLLAYVMGHADLPPARRERVLEYYDASLRFQDGQMGRLFDAMEATGRLDDTLIVVCSDHGKTLGEHDRDTSPPHQVHGTNTDVPLVIRHPGQETPVRVDVPAELTRLFDLLVSGNTSPESAVTTDGFGLIEDIQPHTGRSQVPVTHWRILADGEYRYVRADDGREYLFHGTELVEGEQAMLEWMRSALDERIDRLTPAGERTERAAPIEGAVERQLSDLGYLD